MTTTTTTTEATTKALADMCRNALYVQSACNLSGVIHSMSRDVTTLRELYPDAGSPFYNANPIMALYATQVGHLTKMSPMGDADVYGWCHRWVQDYLGHEVGDTVRTAAGKQVGIVAFTSLLHHHTLGLPSGNWFGDTLRDLVDYGDYWGIQRNGMFYGIEKNSGLIHT